MMRSLLHLLRRANYTSLSWYESEHCKPARFAVRRPSLAQRIDLTTRLRALMQQHEFLQVGDLADQLAASLSELLVRRLYLEWGLAAIEGIAIDGKRANVYSLIEHGPEPLSDEIVDAIKSEFSLSEDERKNC